MSDSISDYKNIMNWLTYLGLIPFILTLVLSFSLVNHSYAQLAFLCYGAVILSFLAGIHWGLAFQKPRLDCFYLILSSNVIALLAWVSLLLSISVVSIIFLLVGFIIQCAIDCRLQWCGVIPRWYLLMRVRVTLIVVIMLIAALFV